VSNKPRRNGILVEICIERRGGRYLPGRTLVTLSLLWLLVVLALAAPHHSNATETQNSTAHDSAQLVDAVIASVDGSPVTMYDLAEFKNKQGRLLPPADQLTNESLLDAMIDSMMFQAEFKEKGIIGMDADVEVYIDNVLASSGSTRDELREALAELGLTWDIYFERMRAEVQRLALINREIRSRVNVTPEEVERHWKDQAEFDLPARVEISDIFIPLPRTVSGPELELAWQRAEQAYKLATRDSFVDAAREYSKGPTAAEGGSLGEFAEGTLAPEFAEQIAHLDEGETSRPFKAGGAIHIVRLDRKLEGGRVPLAQVEAEIREKLYVENLDKRFRRWVEEDLESRHHVTNHLDSLSSLTESTLH